MAEMDLPWLHQVFQELSADFPDLILHNTSPVKGSIIVSYDRVEIVALTGLY